MGFGAIYTHFAMVETGGIVINTGFNPYGLRNMHFGARFLNRAHAFSMINRGRCFVTDAGSGNLNLSRTPARFGAAYTQQGGAITSTLKI